MPLGEKEIAFLWGEIKLVIKPLDISISLTTN